MVGSVPMCLSCQYFVGPPKKYGDTAKCAIKGSCPSNTYWKGSKCATYKRKVNGGRKK